MMVDLLYVMSSVPGAKMRVCRAVPWGDCFLWGWEGGGGGGLRG
jgi:hypothetical protein